MQQVHSDSTLACPSPPAPANQPGPNLASTRAAGQRDAEEPGSQPTATTSTLSAVSMMIATGSTPVKKMRAKQPPEKCNADFSAMVLQRSAPAAPGECPGGARAPGPWPPGPSQAAFEAGRRLLRRPAHLPARSREGRG